MEEIMPRPYSDRFISGLDKADDSKVGVQLAKICSKRTCCISYDLTYMVSRWDIKTT